MKIAIGTDHRGFPIRARIIDLIHRLGHDAEDLGTFTGEAVDYPDVAARSPAWSAAARPNGAS